MTCTSDHPHDQRMRSSAYIQTPSESILIDSGPDLRQQALAFNIRQVDHVLYTHSHLDHIAGFDELRAFCWRREDRLPLYGSKACLKELERIFQWAFSEKNTYQGYIRPESHYVEETFALAELAVTPLQVIHGSVDTNGYLIKSPSGTTLIYMPDVKVIPQRTINLIEETLNGLQLDILIIDALREDDHNTHMSLAESLAAIDELKPKHAYLTHISHELDRERITAALPDHITLAYDSLSFTF